MRILLFLITLCAFSPLPALAASTDSAAAAEAERASLMAYLDSADKAMPYKTGTVALQQFASLNVPNGYKFLPEKEAQWVIEKLWGNPADNKVLGMLVKKDYKLSSDEWAFIYTYKEDGYVKDEDADDINYDDLLTEIQKGEVESNKERTAAGYPAIHMIGWANKPFYDKENKVLHWAKEVQFGDQQERTLNYDVRVLGRKGVLSINAVGTMDQLADVKQHIPDILHAATFSGGYRYKDFDPSVDKVAAYTIGGLIAGKLLLKAGFWVLIVKNIKLVVIGLIAIFGGLRKKIAGLFRRRREDEKETPEFEMAAVPAADTPAPATESTFTSDENNHQEPRNQES